MLLGPAGHGAAAAPVRESPRSHTHFFFKYKKMRWWFVIAFLCGLLVLQAGSAGEKDKKKKKSILDYNDADVERIFQEWEVLLLLASLFWESTHSCQFMGNAGEYPNGPYMGDTTECII